MRLRVLCVARASLKATTIIMVTVGILTSTGRKRSRSPSYLEGLSRSRYLHTYRCIYAHIYIYISYFKVPHWTISIQIRNVSRQPAPHRPLSAPWFTYRRRHCRLPLARLTSSHDHGGPPLPHAPLSSAAAVTSDLVHALFRAVCQRWVEQKTS